MSWKYNQSTGSLTRSGQHISTGYSGHGFGKNNQAMEHIHDTGPIPRGEYDIGPPQYTETHGPHVLALTPRDGNEMFGRSGFLIHGDSINDPGTASKGCIILPRLIRRLISDSGDDVLKVV